MQAHYRSSALLIGCLLIPFGVAIYEDAKAEDGPALSAYSDDFGGDYGEDLYAYDDSDALREYARTQDDYGNYEKLLQEHDELAYRQPQSMGVSFFDATFFAEGKAAGPTLSGPFAGITFGQGRAQVQALHPEAGDYPLALPDAPEATADFEFVSDRLASITVRFPDDGSALRSFTAQWGAPSAAATPMQDIAALWHDDKSKLQARLITNRYDAHSSVTLRPYQELSDFVAPGARLFGFEESDVFSLGADEIQALLASSDYDDQIFLRQPQFADSDAPVTVVLTIKDARIVSATVDLDIDVTMSKQLYQLLEDKLGRPIRKSGDQWGQSYTFKKGPRIVTLSTDGHGWNSILIILIAGK